MRINKNEVVHKNDLDILVQKLWFSDVDRLNESAITLNWNQTVHEKNVPLSKFVF